jgi:hypothetical protein
VQSTRNSARHRLWPEVVSNHKTAPSADACSWLVLRRRPVHLEHGLRLEATGCSVSLRGMSWLSVYEIRVALLPGQGFGFAGTRRCRRRRPSDMMDGRVGALRAALNREGFTEVSTSHTAGNASAFSTVPSGTLSRPAPHPPRAAVRSPQQAQAYQQNLTIARRRAKVPRGRGGGCRHNDGQAHVSLLDVRPAEGQPLDRASRSPRSRFG